MSGNQFLPQYRQDENYASQESYQELFNLLLTRWFPQNGGNVQALYASSSGTLTAAQIKGMYATPVTLLTAPAIDKMIVVQLLVLELVYGTAAFASGGNVYLQYGTTAHGTNYATVATNIPAAFIQGAASATISTAGTINTTTGLATSVASNAPITITNDTGAFTTGTGCSVNWYLWYSIVVVT